MNKLLLLLALILLLPIILLITLSAITPAPAVAAPQAPSIIITQTVGANPAACATAQAITLTVGGGEVTTCYEVTNNGDITLTRHDLTDSLLGPILSAFPYALVPGASAFLTQSVSLTGTTTISATWTAYNPGPTDEVEAVSSVTINVPPRQPAIALQMTVGADPALCATEATLTLPASGGDVTYCYEITNTGNITLTRHDLTDSHLGAILTTFPYALVPGASAFLTQTAHITNTLTSTAVWTAYNPGPTDEAQSNATAHVIVQRHLYLPFWRH